MKESQHKKECCSSIQIELAEKSGEKRRKAEKALPFRCHTKVVSLAITNELMGFPLRVVDLPFKTGVK